MRKQIELTFYVGVSPFEVKACRLEWTRFRDYVISAASEVCGGCTTLEAEGWWKEDGAAHAEKFSGALGKEKCWLLLLSCEEMKSERAYEAVKEAICFAATEFGIKTDWVHVTQKEFIGRHFSVKSTVSSKKGPWYNLEDIPIDTYFKVFLPDAFLGFETDCLLNPQGYKKRASKTYSTIHSQGEGYAWEVEELSGLSAASKIEGTTFVKIGAPNA